MNTDALVPLVVFLLFAFVGWRATRRTFQTYRAIAPTLKPRERLIGQAFVVVCFVISATATIFGVITTRILMGFERLDWTPVITWTCAIAIFLLPPYLLSVYERIGRGP